jgi:hypothetical protein
MMAENPRFTPIELAACRADCIPCAGEDHGDEEFVGTVLKLAEYVVRNGDVFESKVKDKESMNEKFSFLFRDVNPDGNEYYRWMLCCMKHGFTSRDHILAATENAKIHLHSVVPGHLRLLHVDELTLISMLQANTGSKEDIRTCRKWMLSRAHSIGSIAHTAAVYITTRLPDHNNDPLRPAAALQTGKLPPTIFNKVLLTIFVFNDIFVNSTFANNAGPYTKLLYGSHYASIIADAGQQMAASVNVSHIMFPYLVDIYHKAYRCAELEPNDCQGNRDKLEKMIEMWTSRGYLDAQQSDMIVHSMKLREKPAPMYPSIVELVPSSIFHRGPVLPVNHSPAHNAMPLHVPLPPAFMAPPPLPPQYHHTPIPSHFPVHAPSHILPHVPGHIPVAHPPPVMNTIHLQPISVGPPPPFVPPQPPILYPPAPLFNAPPAGASFNAPPPPPTPFNPINSLIITDLTTNTTVGTMANIVKTAIKNGHPRYAPLTTSAMTLAVAPHVEPGRLEARVSDFYRKLQALDSGDSRSGSSEGLGSKRKWGNDSDRY